MSAGVNARPTDATIQCMSTRTYNLWVLVRPAEDLPKTWVAHCLDLDVISQGDSPLRALGAVCEAVSIAVESDLERGADPFERRAPEELWTDLWSLVQRGDRTLKLSVARQRQRLAAATQVQLELRPRARTRRVSRPAWKTQLFFAEPARAGA